MVNLFSNHLAYECITDSFTGMSYFRAEVAQIDAWERMGNTGWNFASLFPYYKKSERFQPPTEQMIGAGASYDPSSHGYDGPITVGFSETMQGSAVSRDTNATMQALGFPASFETNDGSMRGFTLSLSTMDNELNVRQDAARAYYWPHANRTNLHVYLNAFAERIVWTEEEEAELAVAKGVTFTANGTTQMIQAKKEVILSAGALRSPLILEHSGVGNPRYDSKDCDKTSVADPIPVSFPHLALMSR
jgi:choline dehydrogenase-like flavoprotein